MKSMKAVKVEPVCCEERILKHCHQTYTDTDNGLIAIAQSVGKTLPPPRRGITVMLIGNKSAGKSSFINWYVEKPILSKTQGFTFVTSRSKRMSLTSNETFRLYPHFKRLQEVKGVSEYVSAEICTSRQKHFSLVTFVDTPGLVDGDMKYPFDVDQAILQLGDVCDLILVFFDPMGQALCRRTLNIVEQLYERQGDRLRFYLSKADEAGGESDRQRVMMQIVQELHKRPGLNKCAIEMPSIYIPNPNKPSQCVNQIEEVCHTIHKTIKQVVQNTQNTLQKDCDLICEAVTDTLNSDWQCCKEKKKALRLSYALGLLGFSILLLFMLTLGILYRDLLELALGIYGAETLLLYLTPVMLVLDSLPVQFQLITCGFLMQLSVILNIMAFLLFHTKPTLSRKQKRQLQEKLEYLQQVVKIKKELTPGFGVLPPPPPAPPLPPPAPGAETVKSRKPVQTKMQPQLNCQTPSEVKGTVYNKLDDEHLLMMPQKDMISEKNLTTPLKKKDTTPPKVPQKNLITEQKMRQLKRQVSDGAIKDISKYPTMPKVPQNDLITELKKRQLKRQATE
ncbi:uncharacterized protein LOC131363417 isoform X1 [Hemibagrus wyckioides]|uniref:uncharacterized protein LOC131363417 isoform X1 n=1 Tax=Hemibagrus wyckioides TaxID=337641 RepID=UPI00266D8AE0|nr:uncharacterized protein LOC131363417 isoform X1 [Hemibagrus wyckioides]